MKRVTLPQVLTGIVIAILLFNFAFAGSARVPNVTFWPGPKVTLRSDVIVNDSFSYGDVTAIAAQTNLTGYQYALIDADPSGTSVTFTLTPYFGDSDTDVYFKGQSTTLNDNTRYVLEVDGEDEFTIYCSESTTVGASLDIYLTPFNIQDK